MISWEKTVWGIIIQIGIATTIIGQTSDKPTDISPVKTSDRDMNGNATLDSLFKPPLQWYCYHQEKNTLRLCQRSVKVHQ